MVVRVGKGNGWESHGNGERPCRMVVASSMVVYAQCSRRPRTRRYSGTASSGYQLEFSVRVPLPVFDLSLVYYSRG
jgi:hypothetical protein